MAVTSANSITASDEQAIRAVVTRYGEAWNRHQMIAIAELFTEDAQWINIVGMHWQGRTAIVKAHDVFHRTIFQKTELTVVDMGTRALTTDVAAAVITLKVGAFTTPDGTVRPSAGDRLSLILTKRDGPWRIVHGHNTVIDPAAQPFDPASSAS